MKIDFLQMPILIVKHEQHQETKKELLKEIELLGKNSLVDNNERISNTDWHIKSKKTYFNILLPVFTQTLVNLKHGLKLTSIPVEYNLRLTNFWYQQYEQGDYHGWHDHLDAFYSSVYYVELPKNGAKTTFMILGKEYEFDVEEGDILSFPGTAFHCSKPNISEEKKTIVSFNTDFGKNFVGGQ
jgi:hypothetical protein